MTDSPSVRNVEDDATPAMAGLAQRLRPYSFFRRGTLVDKWLHCIRRCSDSASLDPILLGFLRRSSTRKGHENAALLGNRTIYFKTVITILAALSGALAACSGSESATSPASTPPSVQSPVGTPSATATATVLAVGMVAAVDSRPDCLNLREEPSLDARVLKCLADGQRLILLEGPRNSGELLWWRVELIGSTGTGWVAERYVRPG